MFICHLHIFIEKVFVKDFGLFFNLVISLLLSFKCSFYILAILYQIWLANIFSHSMAHFLTLLIWFYCFLQDRSFNFNDIQFINYLFHGSSLLVLPCLFYSLHLIILLTYFEIWFSHLCFCCFFLMTNFPSPFLPYSF